MEDSSLNLSNVPAALGEKHRRPEGESWFWDLEWDSRLDSAVSRQT